MNLFTKVSDVRSARLISFIHYKTVEPAGFLGLKLKIREFRGGYTIFCRTSSFIKSLSLSLIFSSDKTGGCEMLMWNVLIVTW